MISEKRSAGILLHPTSLPSPDGIGDLGPEAYRWISFLAESGCNLWQVLPLGPTGYGDSPYQCFSAFAGNPYLISPTLLYEDGLLTRADLADRPEFPGHTVVYGDIIPWKLTILNRAFRCFNQSPPAELVTEFEEYCQLHAHWLEDFALFMAIKEVHGGASWGEWEMPLRMRQPKALTSFRLEKEDHIRRQKFYQFLFFRQWQALRQHAVQNGIRIIGDAPIFAAFDSSDAWANPELFHLDAQRMPAFVAGVPPDYFSPTGQLWGNPLYRWEVHAKSRFEWWVERMQAALEMVDLIRLDHFRGFAGYWEVPAGMPTAEVGRWVKGPAHAILQAFQQGLHGLPIIAEDLGEITPDVIELRDHYNLPGMKIFQFAFSSDADDPFLPHNYPVNCVAYTGTHDNDTALGWYQNAPENERDFCRRYLARSGENISWDMIRAVWSSVAIFAVAPLQDFLELGSEARMNVPARASGNWSWRFEAIALTPPLTERILEINTLYGRSAKPKPPKP